MSFTDKERKHPLFMRIDKHPDGLIEFHGFITPEALAEIRLDYVEKQVVMSEAKSVADHLQSLEIIFRRYDDRRKLTTGIGCPACGTPLNYRGEPHYCAGA